MDETIKQLDDLIRVTTAGLHNACPAIGRGTSLNMDDIASCANAIDRFVSARRSLAEQNDRGAWMKGPPTIG